ncbi:MAG TPA: protein-L-isoaspartate(D-aspartate) O-methyltransferase [Nitrospinota bacterium]|nr:protein-L-isoaspartate(D-aspartate) O-methyltransferase [Nitrospinota bacterium]
MEYSVARNKMVRDQLINRGIKDQKVLDAMAKIPRHLFVEQALRDRAYGDYPLPIGEKQTISQPYIVALMTEALKLAGDEKVLEIGTGSGYQTAILAELAIKVYSIERIKSLSIKARKNLDKLKYHNTVLKVFDGTYGWKEEAPFNVIMVTAASPNIPETLVDQLAINGRMVIPVGGSFSQNLIKVVKNEEGIKTSNLSGCVFVKLIGNHAWKHE